ADAGADAAAGGAQGSLILAAPARWIPHRTVGDIAEHGEAVEPVDAEVEALAQFEGEGVARLAGDGVVAEGSPVGLAAEAVLHRRGEIGEGVLPAVLELRVDRLREAARQAAVEGGEAEVVVLAARL